MGAGYCLQKQAVSAGGGGVGWGGEGRQEWAKGSQDFNLAVFAPPLLSYPAGNGGLGGGGEADGVWELWVCQSWRTRLCGHGGGKVGCAKLCCSAEGRQVQVWDPLASLLLRPCQDLRCIGKITDAPSSNPRAATVL